MACDFEIGSSLIESHVQIPLISRIIPKELTNHAIGPVGYGAMLGGYADLHRCLLPRNRNHLYTVCFSAETKMHRRCSVSRL